MAGPKRTRHERESDLERISELYLMGKRQVDIAATLGVAQSQVSYDLKEIHERWRERSALNLDERKRIELARLDVLERVYWEAWEKSCNERVRKGVARNSAGDTRSNVTTETTIGNPSFLAGVERCIELRCKLLGLFALPKGLLSSFDGQEAIASVIILPAKVVDGSVGPSLLEVSGDESDEA